MVGVIMLLLKIMHFYKIWFFFKLVVSITFNIFFTIIFLKTKTKNSNLKDIPNQLNALGLIIHEMQKIKSKDFKFIIRDTQLISLLLYITKKPETGRLLQINTGEGKSVIVQIIAAYYALQGKKVDVITSNHTLAKRDAKESQEFFQKLELAVGYIKSKSKAKDFKPDILFGTVHNFCLGLLQVFMGENPVDRKQEMLIVDEVDSMLIDKPNITTYISSKSVFDKEIKGIWDEMSRKFDEMTIQLKARKLEFEENKPKIEEVLRMVAKYKIGKIKHRKIRKLTKSKIKSWIDSLIKAHLMKLNSEYLVDDCMIKIIDNDTGEIQTSMQWSDGLHYFLELKHGINQNNCTSSFLFENHMTYMKRYGSNIIGLTGTLGTKISKGFLRESYNVDMFIIPPYSPLKLNILKPIFCKNQNGWNKRLLLEINQYQSKGLPALLLFETIDKAHVFGKFLKKNNKKFDFYLRSEEEQEEEDEEEEKAKKAKKKEQEEENKNEQVRKLREKERKYFEEIEKQKKAREIRLKNRRVLSTQVNALQEEEKKKILNLNNKSIVLATNLGGRGTDFHVPEDISAKGGLQVIITFIPSNPRVVRQAFGRSGRKGQEGSGIMVVDGSDYNSMCENLVGNGLCFKLILEL
jgi:preprotein translocase subunit SecA